MAILLFNGFSVSSTSFTYGYFSDPLNVPKPVKTVGSSTTVTEVTAGDGPFSGAAVGDILVASVDGTVTTRTVTAVGSAPTSVTVDTAVDWSNGGAGLVISRMRFTSGTAAASGWFSVSNFNEKLVSLVVSAISATSIDVSIEGRIAAGPSPQSTSIYTKSYTAVGSEGIAVTADYDQIRVGVKVTGSTGTNTFTASFNGHLKRR